MKGSWLFTGRRTYYDLVAARITDSQLPAFGDLQAKGVWELRPGPARHAVRAAQPRDDRRVVQRQLQRQQPRPHRRRAQRPGVGLVLLDGRLAGLVAHHRVLVPLLRRAGRGGRRAERRGSLERAGRRGVRPGHARLHAKRHGPRRCRCGRRWAGRRQPHTSSTPASTSHVLRDDVGLGDQRRSKPERGERIERARRSGAAVAARLAAGRLARGPVAGRSLAGELAAADRARRAHRLQQPGRGDDRVTAGLRRHGARPQGSGCGPRPGSSRRARATRSCCSRITSWTSRRGVQLRSERSVHVLGRGREGSPRTG